MKLYTDKAMHSYSKHIVFAMVICPFLTVVSWLGFDNNYAMAAFLTFTIVLIPFGPLMLFLVRHRSMYTVKKDNLAISYSVFGKYHCKVILDQTVYYSEFTADRDKETTQYYAFSNSIFEKPGEYGRLFCYDLNKVIVLPYDEIHVIGDRLNWVKL